jgi:uncharacterized metal-binding protein
MPELPTKKVGLIACCGEEIPEGTVTRLAVRRVLESLRPQHTVTICLPLFLAGGEGDRAFARFHPTIAIDGCGKRCAARGTEMYSGKPAVSIVVNDGVPANSSGLGTARRLSEKGMHVVDEVVDQIAWNVDQLLDLPWNGRTGKPSKRVEPEQESKPSAVLCSCGAGIPVETVRVAGREVALVALPLIFIQFREAGKSADASTMAELMQTVKVYNPIPAEEEPTYAQAILEAYAAFCSRSQ